MPGPHFLVHIFWQKFQSLIRSTTKPLEWIIRSFCPYIAVGDFIKDLKEASSFIERESLYLKIRSCINYGISKYFWSYYCQSWAIRYFLNCFNNENWFLCTKNHLIIKTLQKMILHLFLHESRVLVWKQKKLNISLFLKFHLSFWRNQADVQGERPEDSWDGLSLGGW